MSTAADATTTDSDRLTNRENDATEVLKRLDVERISGSLGAEVRGISLADCSPAEIAAIRSLMIEHQVLFFPDQHLVPDQHIAFGRHFGRLESHPNLNLDSERPEFFELRSEGGSGGIADEWHSDLTCQASPSIFSILQMKTCPAVGGDTLWANAYKAYEELSEPMKDLCQGLSALHDASPHFTPERKAIHPVVRIHPETGRKSLFVNEHFTRRIVEMSAAESDMLLGHLVRWIASSRFTVRYRWSEGTVAMWDNRCTQHQVLNDFEGERVIQRVTVMGDQPDPAAPTRYKPFSSPMTAASWRDAPLKKFLEGQRD